MNFGKNIKKIRAIKKLSQSAFAELFDIKRSSIGAYEEGRAEPKLEVIIRIAKHFSISVDNLVNSDITVNELAHFKTLDDYLSGSPIKDKELSEVQANIQAIPLVKVQSVFEKPWVNLIAESTQKIALPGLDDNLLAFVFNKEVFDQAPKHFKNDDLVVIKNVEADSLIDNVYLLLKCEKQLMLGELKPIGKKAYLFITDNQEIIELPKQEIQQWYIIEKHLVNHPVVVDDASDKIKKLERLVHDLYHRIE